MTPWTDDGRKTSRARKDRVVQEKKHKLRLIYSTSKIFLKIIAWGLAPENTANRTL